MKITILHRTVITLVLLVIIFSYVEPATIWNTAIQIGPYSALGCAVLLIISTVLGIIRWWICLDDAGVQIKFKEVVYAHLIGSAIGSLLVSGIGGPVSRAGILMMAGAGAVPVVASLIAERIYAMLSIVVFFALSLIALTHHLQLLSPQHIANVGGWQLLSFIVIFGIFGWLTFGLYRRIWQTPWLRDRLDKLLRSFPKHFSWMPFWITMATWFISFSCAAIIAADLGVRAPIYLILAIQPFVLFLATLPISLGGWGVREASMVVGFASIGVPADLATSISVIYGLISVASALIGGGIGILVGR